MQRTTEAAPHAPVVPVQRSEDTGAIHRLIASRASPVAWAAAAAGLALAAALSFVLGGKAVRSAERAGQDRAAGVVRTTLDPALTSDQLDRPIVGDRHDQLVQLARDQIFSEESVARVRIWNLDHVLVFSTHPRDREGATAGDAAPIDAAATGNVVSSIAGPRPPQDGLAGSAESMYVTFVPLRLADRAGVAGVVEVDQHEGAMTADARWLWRGGQALATLLLLCAIAMLLLSLRVAPRATPGARRAARQADGSERDRSARQIARLKATLAERGAALDAARKEGDAALEGLRREGRTALEGARRERDALATSLKEAEARAVQAEAQAVQAEARVAELESEQARLGDELERALARATEAPAAADQVESLTPATQPIPDQLEADGEPDDLDVDGLVVEDHVVDATVIAVGPEGEVPALRAVPEPEPERFPTDQASSDGPGDGLLEAWGSGVDVTPLEDPDGGGGLSLRARLARAAAARHRFGAEAETEAEEPPLSGERR